MIDGSEKRSWEGGFWTLEFACFWKVQYLKQAYNFLTQLPMVAY